MSKDYNKAGNLSFEFSADSKPNDEVFNKFAKKDLKNEVIKEESIDVSESDYSKKIK